MTTLYYENEMAKILEEIEMYIETCDPEERDEYYYELEKVKNDFVSLCESGVFHDACGKCMNILNDGLFWLAEVETEY